MTKTIISVLLACLVCSPAFTRNIDNEWLDANYNKSGNMVAMRDGTRLCTIVYSPKDSSETHPKSPSTTNAQPPQDSYSRSSSKSLSA